MKAHQENFVPRKTVLAIHAALLAMAMSSAAQAAEPTVAELTTPEKSIEIGALYTGKDSYKFGEYNGLRNKGAHAAVNVDLNSKGGDDSAFWGYIRGTDLGLDNRNLQAEGGQQGKFNVQVIYDELQHNISDSYRTPFLGAGTTALTLPSSYPAIGTRISSTSTSQTALANWANIQSPNAVVQASTATNTQTGPGYLIPALMHNENISTKRTKIGVNGSVEVGFGWQLSAGLQSEEKKGTKLTGFAFASASTAAMLVEPINYRTDTYNLGASFKGEQATFNANYNYSVFRNNIGSWTAATPFATGSVLNNQAMMSSAPDNQMHQVILSGTYAFSKLTRLSYEYAKARMSQNAAFNCQTGTAAGCLSGQNGWVIPGATADAKVNTDLFFLKMTSRFTSEWNLAGSYKHDRRDNQTPVRSYTVNFADAAAAATNVITNDPISTTKDVWDFSADYAFKRGQAIKFGFQQEEISRTSSGSGYAPSRTQATANTNDFTLPVHKTRETTWSAEYRNSLVEDVTARVSYARSSRKHLDFSNPTLVNSTASLAITNPYYRSFVDFFVANRVRDKIRSALNYQASEQVGFGFTADFNRDSYAEGALKDTRSSTFTVDMTYTPTERFSLSPYYTYENRKTALTGKYITLATANAKLNGVAVTCTAAAPCTIVNGDWALNQADRIDTLGITGKYKGLASGKLDMTGDLLLIFSRTPITASGAGAVVSDGAAVPNYTSLSALSFPDITSKTLQFRLTGDYKLDKAQTVRVSYMLQKLVSSDWQYDAYTNPVAMQSYIGTGMTSPQHTVNAIGATYIYKF